MNHQLAVDTRATERYLLDELDEASRLAFEEHYFSCQSCADDVRAAVQFVDNAKAVMRGGELRDRQPDPRVWLPWGTPVWAASAALSACLLIGYLLPHPRQAALPGQAGGLVTSFAVPAGVRGGAQAAGQTIVAARDASYILLRLDVADGVTAPRLLWRVKTASGEELRFQTLRDDQAVLPLRAADFPTGRYEVVLSADEPGSAVIDRYPFAIGPR